MNPKTKFDELVGREWLYSPTRKNLVVQSWEMKDDTFTLQTTEGPLTCPFGQHDEWLKNFLPVEDDDNAKAVTITRFNVPANSVFAGDTMGKLRDILMDNIEKVKEDKNYIPQAQTINDNAKALIDMAKTEVDLYKAVSQLKK